MKRGIVDTPVGPMVAVFLPNGALAELTFARKRTADDLIGQADPPEAELMSPLTRQIRAYFDGTLKAFDLELAPQGTSFQLAVWEELRKIPYGATTTYGKIANDIGAAGHARAVGAANGANPIPIIIPCHRVIGANGTLVGYGGGLDVKRALLDHESGVRAFELL